MLHFHNPMASPRKAGCLIALLVASVGIGHESAAAEPPTVVSPTVLDHPPAEIAPGGTVVLRGNSPEPAEPSSAPDLPGTVPPSYGWDRRYDASGIDLRYDTSGRDRAMDNRYDASGFDGAFDASGLRTR
jgi:hypothetical protein